MQKFVSWCLGAAFATGLAATAYALDDADMIAAYLFDEGSGDTAADISGNGYEGVISAGGWVEGVYGEAVEFTGGQSHMAAADVFLALPNNAITIGAWFQLREHATYEGIIGGSEPDVGENAGECCQ